MMKIKTKMLIIVMSFSLLQGCPTFIPINTQTSQIKEVAKCIADRQSHGQCNESGTFSGAHIQGGNIRYFDVLATMNVPEMIEHEKLSKFSGKSSKLQKIFESYANKYGILTCDSDNYYNKEFAIMAKGALKSDSNKKIHELFEKQLSGGSISPESIPAIEFNINDFSQFLEDIVEADSYGGNSSLQCATLQNMSTAKSQDEMHALGALLKELSYIESYFKAYFRHGRFIQGTIKVNELYERLKKKILNEAPWLSGNQAAYLANSLFKKLTGKDYENACPSGGSSCSIAFAGHLEAKQFVTRAGVEYGFPHITVSIDPLAEKKVSVTEIDWNKIGAEVAKVFIEAVGDTFIELPADTRSTACEVNKDLCYSEETGGIPRDKFDSVAEHSDMIDTIVSNAAGKTIRGIGWISLNNEAIAKIFESTIGTAAKKVAEKVAYCTYSCTANNIKGVKANMTLGKVKVKISR